MPKSKNSESKSNKVLNASENNTKQVEKLSIELNNLSNEIESHGKKLQIRKEKYEKIAEENGQFVKKLKKPLKDLKENLESLEYLVDKFLGELTARNLSVSTCPDLLNLKADISSSLKYVDILESERIENKYGLDKKYTDKYLTISKKSSGRGVSCVNACEEIEKTVADLKMGDISLKKAEKIKNKYSDLLEVSKKGLANLEKKAKEEISKSGGTFDEASLVRQYAAYRTRLNKEITGLNKKLQTGENTLEYAKRTAPSDDSFISKIESWVKSVTVKGSLLFLGTITVANIGAISKFFYQWAMGE